MEKLFFGSFCRRIRLRIQSLNLPLFRQLQFALKMENRFVAGRNQQEHDSEQRQKNDHGRAATLSAMFSVFEVGSENLHSEETASNVNMGRSLVFPRRGDNSISQRHAVTGPRVCFSMRDVFTFCKISSKELANELFR